MIKPAITVKAVDGAETLAVWPPIPEVTEFAVIQIDAPHRKSVTVEYAAKDAKRIAAAIIAAAKGAK